MKPVTGFVYPDVLCDRKKGGINMAKKKENVFLAEMAPFLSKRYEGEKAASIMAMAWKRYREICEENAQEPKAMYMHTRERIYPGIAAFDALTANGEAREQAADFIEDYYAWRSRRMADLLHKLMKIPGCCRLVPKFFKSMTRSNFGPKAGFQAVYYETTNKVLRFDMIKCPYFDICKAYGCEEIVRAYCHADDICYGSMHPRIEWGRTQTLGDGGTCCDFKITVKIM